jgi:hypothetical protein
VKTFDVVCHVDGCENEDIVINIPSQDKSPVVVCGPCGTLITDIVSV